MDAFRYLLGLIACAFAMGTVFDIYNTVTGSTKWLRWLRPMMDILFWVLSACLVYYVAFVTDNGQLRIYTLVILLIGYGLYRLLAHRIVVGGAYGVVRVARGLAKLVLSIISVLVFQPLRILFILVWTCMRWLYKTGEIVEDGLFALVHFAWKIVWFPFRNLWPKNMRWQTEVQRRWEDFWVWLSNRLTERSERV